jgi:hypothetical protein
MKSSITLVCAILAGVPGCDSGRSRIVWESNTLSDAQESRQEQLLQELAPSLRSLSDSLDRTPAAEYRELLSLPDKIGVRDDETIYSFNVLTDGDVQEPGELVIIVATGRIKFARWPYSGEY